MRCFYSIGCSLGNSLYLGVYLRIPLGFPCIEFLVCLLLGERAFCYTALEMFSEEDSLI